MKPLTAADYRAIGPLAWVTQPDLPEWHRRWRARQVADSRQVPPHRNIRERLEFIRVMRLRPYEVNVPAPPAWAGKESD